jgi:hypothetical protein
MLHNIIITQYYVTSKFLLDANQYKYDDCRYSYILINIDLRNEVKL